MRAPSISSVAVAGGGIVGWSAAAALKRRIPALRVTVIPVAPPPDALADRIGCTLPSIGEFHGDLGLTEADTVTRARSGFRLGTRFEGWAADSGDYVHAYGDYGVPFGASSFHHHWVRSVKAGSAAPFDDYSPAARIGDSGRFSHPLPDPESPLSQFGYGLQIDPPRYREMMRALALHLGVIERPGVIGGVRLREDGFVDALQLQDGTEVLADLFVDATGPASLVRGSLEESWEDWSRWLPADRVLIADGGGRADAPPLDRAVAIPAGWRWEAASPALSSHGLTYSSRHLDDGKAAEALRGFARAEPSEPIAIRAGRRAEPWLRNCVAVGDAAVAVEPLEWTNLHLAHSAIDRMVAMMPDRDCNRVELWDYNRQTAAEADRVRDFLVLHYVAARRPPDAFWREVAAIVPPASLAHTLTQFSERGRLPFYEDETFSRHSWLAVLLGQGVIPRRVDPLTDIVPPVQAERTMMQMQLSLRQIAQTLPSHAEYLRNFSMQAAR